MRLPKVGLGREVYECALNNTRGRCKIIWFLVIIQRLRQVLSNLRAEKLQNLEIFLKFMPKTFHLGDLTFKIARLSSWNVKLDCSVFLALFF